MSSNLDFVDVEKQVNREAEGQDTITPLTNTVILKQLNKLRRVSSNKTINSINSSSTNFNSTNRYSSVSDSIDANENEDKKSVSGLSQQLAKKKSLVPESFANLFRTRSESRSAQDNVSNIFEMLDKSFYDSNSTTNFNDANDVNTNNAKPSASRLMSINDVSSTQFKRFSNHLKSSSAYNNSVKTSYQVLNSVTTNVTDRMFDALSSILMNNQHRVVRKNDPDNTPVLNNEVNGRENREKLIESVKLVVKQSELIKKHKLNTSIFICRSLTFFVFMFMLVFAVFFLRTILSIWQSFSLLDEDNNNKLLFLDSTNFTTDSPISNSSVYINASTS